MGPAEDAVRRRDRAGQDGWRGDVRTGSGRLRRRGVRPDGRRENGRGEGGVRRPERGGNATQDDGRAGQRQGGLRQ